MPTFMQIFLQDWIRSWWILTEAMLSDSLKVVNAAKKKKKEPQDLILMSRSNLVSNHLILECHVKTEM